MGRVSRNEQLIAGVNRYGRSASSSKHQRYFHSKKPVKKEEKKAVVSTKQPRWYAADDVKTPIPSRKNRHKQTKLRSTITPGTVLILLAGRFKGKRVVFLKQLDSGLLLVSGPFKINGVPLRRVNQAYVIATSLKLDIASVDVADIADAYFAREKKVASKKDGDEFFKAEDKKAVLSDEKKATQKKVDSALIPLVEKVPNLYPEAIPFRITQLVSNLASATVPAPRLLTSSLVQKLNDIADHHRGTVPLHSRLFAQWMHHAYPRECPYPHLAGTTSPKNPMQWMEETGMETIADERTMRKHAEEQGSTSLGSQSEDLDTEYLPWLHEEELFVARQSSGRTSLRSVLRAVAMLAAVFAMAVNVKNSWGSLRISTAVQLPRYKQC